MFGALSQKGGAATPNDFGGFSRVTVSTARITTSRLIAGQGKFFRPTIPVGRSHALACASRLEGR
jgi:hypothetical protein